MSYVLFIKLSNLKSFQKNPPYHSNSSHLGRCCCLGGIWQGLKTFLVLLVGEVRDAAKHPAVHHRTPMTKTGPKCQEC